VHYRAPPNERGSGKERGHGVELPVCPACGEELEPGKHHNRCKAGRTTNPPSKRMAKGSDTGARGTARAHVAKSVATTRTRRQVTRDRQAANAADTMSDLASPQCEELGRPGPSASPRMRSSSSAHATADAVGPAFMVRPRTAHRTPAHAHL
jgi:hypothetical protein